jgi:ankyrin repeat protein
MKLRKGIGWFLGLLGIVAACGFTVKSNSFLFWTVTHQFESLSRLSLRLGSDPNARKNSRTVLMEASLKAETAVVEDLLSRGALVSATDEDQQQAIHYAAVNAQKDGSVVRLLLEHGANPVAASKNGMTPLILAASELSGSSFADVITMIAYVDDVNQQDNAGTTALWVATTEARTETLRALLRAGANPNLLTRKGRLPIALAASNGLADRVKLLLAFGADPNLKANNEPSAAETVRGTAPNREMKASFEEIARIFESHERDALKGHTGSKQDR